MKLALMKSVESGCDVAEVAEAGSGSSRSVALGPGSSSRVEVAVEPAATCDGRSGDVSCCCVVGSCVSSVDVRRLYILAAWDQLGNSPMRAHGSQGESRIKLNQKLTKTGFEDAHD